MPEQIRLKEKYTCHKPTKKNHHKGGTGQKKRKLTVTNVNPKWFQRTIKPKGESWR